MSSTMAGLVIDRSKDDWDNSRGFRLEEVPRPRLDEVQNPSDSNCVLIEMIHAGVCGSDRGIWFRKAFKDQILGSLDQEARDVRVVGHELLGRIIEMGSAVRRAGSYRMGEVVAAESHVICGHCYQCRIGATHVCQEQKILGISRDGCFAEIIKVPVDILWPTDLDKIDPRVAAVQEPFGNAVHACQVVDLRGRTVGVFGCGTIGLFVTMVARALGASRVIGIEPLETNRQMALQLGADEVIPIDVNPRGEEPWAHDPQVAATLQDITRGNGVDVAFEMAGHNNSVNNAIQSTTPGGDVVLFGIHSGNFQIESFDQLIMNGINLHSVIGRRIFHTWYVTRSLLEDKSNRIQSRILDVILGGGEETLYPLGSFEQDSFERLMLKWPKLVLTF